MDGCLPTTTTVASQTLSGTDAAMFVRSGEFELAVTQQPPDVQGLRMTGVVIPAMLDPTELKSTDIWALAGTCADPIRAMNRQSLSRIANSLPRYRARRITLGAVRT